MTATDNTLFWGVAILFIVSLLLSATSAVVAGYYQNKFYNKALESCHPLALESYDLNTFTYVCADPCEYQEELCCKEKKE